MVKNGVKQYKGVIHCFNTILKTEGIRGFYAYKCLFNNLVDWVLI